MDKAAAYDLDALLIIEDLTMRHRQLTIQRRLTLRWLGISEQELRQRADNNELAPEERFTLNRLAKIDAVLPPAHKKSGKCIRCNTPTRHKRCEECTKYHAKEYDYAWKIQHDQRPHKPGNSRKPHTVLKRHGTVDERFWIKIRITESECWQWIGALSLDGYGQFSPKKGVNKRAHRWAYERFIGPIPEKLTLDHLCRNKQCVNPWHCEPVTFSENVRRGAIYRASQKNTS
jgi:hypothetical protein